jgi:hypothetical protein
MAGLVTFGLGRGQVLSLDQELVALQKLLCFMELVINLLAPEFGI